MDNNCLLFGSEIASFALKIANLKTSENSDAVEKYLLENDNIIRQVVYVSFADEYFSNNDYADRVFYILEGSGRFDFNNDYLRYIAGDIVSAPAGDSWAFSSDRKGTKLIEVCVPQKAKTAETDELQNQPSKY